MTTKQILTIGFIVSLLFLCFSCNDLNEELYDNSTEEMLTPYNVGKKELDLSHDFVLFSKILSKAVYENKDLRKFIKSEALKKIDQDFDVFYSFVKNDIVSDNLTFRDVLISYSDDEASFQDLEKRLPLLTIYVPELPSDFNAETWNADEEIPSIFPLVYVNDSLIFFKNGKEEYSLPFNFIPALPTLVIKNNERIIQNKSLGVRSVSENTIPLDNEFSFIDEVFDGRNPNTSFRSTPTPNFQTSFRWVYLPDQQLDPLLTAYHEMGVDITKWQRDNIYYGLTDQIQEGPLKRNFVERIFGIKFSVDAYNKFTDQNDPKPNPSAPTPSQLWTDGQFEFRIDILINNKAGAGTNIYKHFRAKPAELFNVLYSSGTRDGKTYYYITSVQPKPFNPNRDNFNLNLVTWDLKNNGSTWKFIISEIDDQETYTTEDSNTVTYAQNFEFSQQWGDEVKKGIKYGNTTTISGVNRYNIVTYKNSDDLGTLEANFSDPVVIHATDDKFDGVALYSVSNPFVEMALVPVRLY